MSSHLARPSRLLLGSLLPSLLIAAMSVPATVHAQSWSFRGKIAAGRQFDVVRGPNKTIHLVSSRYYRLDAAGAVVADEAVGDGQSGSLSFPPAIAVGDDGSVHLVTRHGGDFTNGFQLRYRRKNASGQWDRDYDIGTPVKRNYVVGAAWLNANQVVLLSTQGGSNVWGDLHLWMANASSATKLGSISGIWRADCDARLRAGSRLWLSSGKPDPGGTGAYLLHAGAGAQLVADLKANQKTHKGSGRTGFATTYVDGKDNVHFTYGAFETVYYNQYTASGSKRYGSDKQLFSGLGSWHMSTGLSAVAASDDGKQVVAVALRSDGSKTAGNSALLVARSSDGGKTFGAAKDLNKKTDGGEGRLRPRLLAIGNTFYLFYYDNTAKALSLATLTIPVDADKDGHDASVDCDDGDAQVHPGAPERCNGKDDNCDKKIDEGCPEDAGVPDLGLPDSTPAVDLGDRDGPSADTTAPQADGSTSDGGDLSSSVEGGCGCRTQGSGSAAGLLSLSLLGLLALRRRRGA